MEKFHQGNYVEERTIEFVCTICHHIVGDDTLKHRQEKQHYEFIGTPSIKRKYIIQ